MKKLYLLLIVPLLSLPFFGFVSSDSYPVYSGTLSYIDTQYSPVVNLNNQSINFWLNDYDVALSTNNYLVNVSANTLTGTIQIGNNEYNCRITSGSSVFEIYQQYQTSYGSSSTWVDYHLTPDSLPTNSAASFDSWIYVAILVPVVFLAVFGVVKFIMG